MLSSNLCCRFETVPHIVVHTSMVNRRANRHVRWASQKNCRKAALQKICGNLRKIANKCGPQFPPLDCCPSTHRYRFSSSVWMLKVIPKRVKFEGWSPSSGAQYASVVVGGGGGGMPRDSESCIFSCIHFSSDSFSPSVRILVRFRAYSDIFPSRCTLSWHTHCFALVNGQPLGGGPYFIDLIEPKFMATPKANPPFADSKQQCACFPTYTN